MLRNLGLLFLLLNVSLLWAEKASGEDDESPIVETLNGPIRGFKFKLPVVERKKTEIDSANIYLGVPYAQPPIKNLRFEVTFKNQLKMIYSLF